MNRLSDNDKNFGPFTLGSWNTHISVRLASGDDEDPGTHLLFTACKRALRVKLPDFLKPVGNYGEVEREYGFSLSKEGNGYDFFQIFYGPQPNDGRREHRRSWFLPWKQWNHVRNSIYNPDGTHFATEKKGAHWHAWFETRQQCPRVHFGFEDYDGEMIVASCRIEEREWHRGEKWFKWLRHFYKPRVRRSLDLEFSAEVGTGKGSWKGGTIGHGIDMLEGETPEQAFRRYCTMDHERKGRKYRLKFIGPCGPPKSKETAGA